MAVKKIRRAAIGTCVVVGDSGETKAEELPSTVRLTLQRPRGGCLCLGKKSRQVALFTFSERPSNYHRSYAVLDLEKLFKYSTKENTQIKICVEQRRGGKRVARIPLDEFFKQLFCVGPCGWFFLYVHKGHITLSPSSNPHPYDAPEWPFESTGSFHKQDTEDERDRSEKACVVVNDVIDSTTNDLKGINEHIQKEEAAEESVTQSPTLPEDNKITSNKETISDEDKEEEEEDCQWITLDESSSENDGEGLHYDKDHFTYGNHVTEKDKKESESDSEWITEEELSSESYDEEQHYDENLIEHSDQVTGEDSMTAIKNNELEEVAGLRKSLSRLLLSPHGVIIIACFFSLVAALYDFMTETWEWSWA